MAEEAEVVVAGIVVAGVGGEATGMIGQEEVTHSTHGLIHTVLLLAAMTEDMKDEAVVEILITQARINRAPRHLHSSSTEGVDTVDMAVMQAQALMADMVAGLMEAVALHMEETLVHLEVLHPTLTVVMVVMDLAEELMVVAVAELMVAMDREAATEEAVMVVTLEVMANPLMDTAGTTVEAVEAADTLPEVGDVLGDKLHNFHFRICVHKL